MRFFFAFFQRRKLLSHVGDFLLGARGGVLVALSHEGAYLLADGVASAAQKVAARLCLAEFLVHGENFVHEGEFFLLKFLSDVLFDEFGIVPDEFDVYHFSLLIWRRC